MDVGWLKKQLQGLADDTEIFVSPMMDIAFLEQSGEQTYKPMPDPSVRYKIVDAGQFAPMSDKIGKFYLVLGFDDSRANSLEEEADINETDNFIN
jgi:hypothetical protein